jgi:peptide/nickel transport system permease protein
MTDATLAAIADASLEELESPARRALRRLFARKGAVVGLVVIATFIVLAVFAPLISPSDPIATSWTLVRKPPSALHWFGTDELGRDIFGRVIYGARASLVAGAISVGIALGIGVPFGLLSGYRGGFIDGLISRITDAMLACPFLILAIALAAFLGPSLGNAMIAIGISATPIFIRLTRGQVMSVKVEDYVEAARAMGNPRWRIALFHILPNIMPALLVQAAAARAVMGQHAERGTALPDQRAMDGAMAGTGDLPGGAVVQPGRRRPARRARSKGAVSHSFFRRPGQAKRAPGPITTIVSV